jgi:hypothetical protein
MANNLELPELEPYVLSLIVVAAEGANALSGRSTLIENTALGVALQWIGQLPEAASGNGRARPLLTSWLGPEKSPQTAFELAAYLIDAVDGVVRQRHPSISLPATRGPSKFDQHVFQAMGQTIARATGFRHGDGPSVDVALARLSEADPRRLQQEFLRNYLGNMLQDYFDECGMRAKFAKLPHDEEEALRTDDADALADTVFKAVGPGDGPAKVEHVLAVLGKLIACVWHAERKLDDDQH